MDNNLYNNLKTEEFKKFEAISNTKELNPSFSTNAIHAGQKPEQIHGSINVPIHFSSTYAQHGPSELYSKFDYTRCGNPTVDALNECFASLEHSKYAITFSSGCAAINAVISMLNPGDEIIGCDDVYGGTNRQLNRYWSKYGIKTKMVNLTNLDSVRNAMTSSTKMIWIESPSNPTLKVIDIEGICKIAKEKGVLVITDNTFATSYLQSPILLGSDIVLHSCTKYISGHADVIAGCIMTNNKDLYDQMYFCLGTNGACISPFDAYILLRSLKTLKVRVNEHCKNAEILANYLVNHSKVEKVIYPGLKSHPDHEVAKAQMRKFGAMISFYYKGNLEETKAFIKKLKVITLAESLGGVESLIELPFIMTHASVPEDQRVKLGISENFVRLSVGIEDAEDLLSDLENAL